MVKYCIYCGEEHKKGHSKSCPLISGIPKGVYGIGPREEDIEYNLSLGRMGILGAFWNHKGKIVVGPQDKTIKYRLVYEQIAFQIRRIKSHQLHHSSKSESLLGFYHRNKLKKLDKDFDKIKEFAKAYDFPISEVEEIDNSEKIMLANYSGKEQIPAYRDSETKQLIYMPVE